MKAEEDAEKIWHLHRQHLKKGDWQKSQGELEKLYQWKLDQGIPNHYPYALALIRESQDIAREGEPEAISDLLNFAEKMAPDFSQVAFARARWLWSQNPFSLDKAGQAVWYWYQGVLRSFYNFEEALPQIASLSFWILLSFLITFGAFSCSLLFRHYSLFAHQLKHLVRLEIPPRALGALTILILFSPFFLGLGWMWLFVLWLLIFAGVSHRTDRVVSIALLAVLLLLPTAIRIYSSLLTSLTENGIPEITRANTGAWSVDLHRKLVALKQTNPRDADILQALGLAEKRMGKFPEAEQNILQWTNLQPYASEAYNNLGNIYLVTNQTSQAVAAYKKALAAKTSKAEPHYNLGQAYLLNFQLNEAEVEFRRARELKPQLISYYTRISSRNPNRMVIDQTIEPLRLWERVFFDNPERERISKGSWEFLWNGVPLKYGEVTVAVILGLLLLVQIFSGNSPSIRICERCGHLICSRCTRSMVMGKHCSQCVTALSASRSADPQVVKGKKAEIARYRSRRKSLPRLYSLILPGAGHLLVGRAKEGTIYLFFLFLTKIILWQEWVPSPLVLITPSSLPWIVVVAFLFSLYYGLVQYRMFRIHSKGGRSHFRTA
jgi:tetratricopeptide (TPR) repeat protein